MRLNRVENDHVAPWNVAGRAAPPVESRTSPPHVISSGGERSMADRRRTWRIQPRLQPTTNRDEQVVFAAKRIRLEHVGRRRSTGRWPPASSRPFHARHDVGSRHSPRCPGCIGQAAEPEAKASSVAAADARLFTRQGSRAHVHRSHSSTTPPMVGVLPASNLSAGLAIFWCGGGGPGRKTPIGPSK